MNELENRIRDALRDPRRELPSWHDPMRRIRRTARRRRVRLVLAGTVAGALAAAVAATVIIPYGPSRPAGQMEPSGRIRLDAAKVLHRAALAALAAPVPHKNQFIYVEYLRRTSGQARLQIFEWLSIDGKRNSPARTVPCGVPHDPGCRMWVSATGDMFTYAGLEKLPTAPSALLGYLYGEQTKNCDPGMIRQMSRAGLEWSGIYTVLSDVPLLPPRFGAALFNAAAHIPGVRVISNVSTATGQRGIAVARTVHAKRWNGGLLAIDQAEFVFNPHTYRYLGNIEKGPITAQHLTSNALVKTKFVDTAPAGSFHVGWYAPACIGL